MKLLILCCVLVILTFSEYTDGKRGGGGSRGGSSRKSSSGGGGGWWSWGSSNNKKSSSKKGTTGTQTAPDSIPKQPEVSKPSAPKNPNPEPGFKKESANVQQSSNLQNGGQQRPIGWDVPGSPGANPNGGWKSGYQGVQSGVAKPPASKVTNPEAGFKKESANVQQSSYPQNGQQRQNGWDVPGSPGANPNGGWRSGNQGYQTHQQGQAYPQHGQAYPQHGQAYPQHGQAYPQQGHGGYGGGMGGYGGYGGGMGGYGGYGGGMGGYGGGMGGYGGGMGGFGGGMGGYGGYGMQKKSGLFSGSTFRNVLTGMFIWHMTSSLLGGFQSKRPYNVYNYYNQPPVQEEIKLPSNVLTMCEGNVTQLCTGSTAICTTNSTVLCVLTMSGATPCAEEKTLCVNTTIPCSGSEDPACRQNGTPKKEADVAVPCLTNLTMDVNLLNETGGAKSGEQYKYCVTTMAMGGPEYKTCDGEDAGSNDWKSVLEGTYTWNLTLPTMKRPYSVYNYHHPPGDAPSGEVVLPAGVLVTCPENATRLCAPKLTAVCTTFNEIMCLDASISADYCERYNTTCLKTSEGDGLMPCFTNITVNANSPNFDIGTFDGASSSLNGGTISSFTYHFHYCVTTLGIPGNETDVCIYGKR